MRRPSMSPPERKKRRTEKPRPLNQCQSLPQDLLVSCFARVSRLYYPVLSLVSKSFRSLLTSPELYKTRASLGRTDTCFYVCLRFPYSDPNPRWFTLGRIHDHHKLFRVPIPNSPPLHSSSLIVLGSDIYNIGGSSKKTPSSSVSVLDCQSHTWHEAPSMLVKRKLPSFRVFDGKIYVRGGHKDYRLSSPQKEAFDPKTHTWAPEPDATYSHTRPHVRANGVNPFRDICERAEFEWNTEFVGPMRKLHWDLSCYCIIEDVVYGYGDGEFKWYDTNVCTLWKDLEGPLPKIDKSRFVKMVNYGGKLAVLWDKFVSSSGYKKNRVIYFGVIALERRNWQEYEIARRGIYGSVEWCDAVLSSVPKSCEFVNALVATVGCSEEDSVEILSEEDENLED